MVKNIFMKRKIIVVCGPTASGKTTMAVELAKEFNGEIISADSRQVYRRLDIGTGKDLKEYGKVTHHLIDICEPEESFSVFNWLPLAQKAILDILSRGKTPIITGGTGLYIQALVEGFKQTTAKKIKGKKYSRTELENMEIDNLREILKKMAPKIYEKIDQKNPIRLIRAIERAQEGIEISKSPPAYDFLQLAICLPREKLYQKIDRRVDERFSKEGMLEEVSELLQSGVDPKWLNRLGLEYRIISNFLLENPSKLESNHKPDRTFQSKEFKQMAQELKYKIHAFARRQITWFKRFPEIIWVDNLDQAQKEAAKFLCK